MLNSNDRSILNGSILSDGCITKVPKCKNYYFCHTSTAEEYVDMIKDTVSFHVNKTKTKPRSHVLNGKEIKGKNAYQIKSRTHEEFTEYRNKWYPNGKKIVPKDLLLDPLCVLHWYLGDGSIDNQTGIHLCTDSFDKESLLILSKKLSKIVPNKITNKNRLLIKNANVYEFFGYIGRHPVVGCYEYKWDTIVKESYLGRKCKECGVLFDAKTNSKYFCSHKCYMRNWRRNGPTIRVAQEN